MPVTMGCRPPLWLLLGYLHKASRSAYSGTRSVAHLKELVKGTEITLTAQWRERFWKYCLLAGRMGTDILPRNG